MARRPLTGNNNTIDISEKIGQKTEGTLLGVRAIDFGFDKRKNAQDIRYIADMEGPDGDFSFWTGTQLRNLLVNTETGDLKVKRYSYLWITYDGPRPTKGGGNDTKIFSVEIDDEMADQGAPRDGKPEPASQPEPVAAGRGNGRRRN